MSLGKAIGCGFVSILAFVALIIGVVFWATGGITDTADEFFASAREGDYGAAYELTSQQLQEQLSEEELEAFMVENGLDDVTETSWSSRSINNDRGELSGSVTTGSGGKIPLDMDLIKEGEDWKVVFMDVGSAGVSSD